MTEGNGTRGDYETKFAEFIGMCSEAKAQDIIIVANPGVLGDTYAELIESNRMRRLFRVNERDDRAFGLPSSRGERRVM